MNVHPALTTERVILLLAVLLALVLWLVGRPSEAEAEAAAPALADLRGERVADHELAEIPDDRRAALEVQAASGDAVAAEPPAPAIEPPAHETDEYLLRGSAVVLDPDGLAHVAEDGKLELVASRGTYGRRLFTEVEDGLWSCMIPVGTQVSVNELELGGRPVFFDGGRHVVTIPDTRFLEIEGRWTASATLIVRDASTGFELDQLEVLKVSSLASNDDQHPGRRSSSRRTGADKTSPIDLLPMIGNGRERVPLFVRRPGYAWGRVDVDPSNSGERLLELVPGGDIRIELTGAEPPRKAWLRLHSEGQQDPFVEFQVGIRDVFELESVPEGKYSVEVTLGQWFKDPVVLGSAEVEVTATQEASVAVPLESGPELQLAPLGGTLFFPEGWKIDPLILSARLQGPPVGNAPGRHALYERDMEQDPDRPGLFHWQLPEVQVGTWEIVLHEPPMGVRVEVGPEGRTDVSISIPRPTRVSLHLLDADTGSPAEVERIMWNPPRPEGSNGGMSFSVVPDPETGTFEFQAPFGDIWVSVWDEDYEGAFLGQQFELFEGTNVLTMEVRRAISIRVVLKDGDTTLPWEGWEVIRKRTDGTQLSLSSGNNPEGLRLTAESPGTYRLEFPQVIPGYLPLEPIEVEFEPGPCKTVEVPLVRAH